MRSNSLGVVNPQSDIGVIGLAVMGANLALNLADSGNRVSVYNRTTSVTHEFIDGEAAELSVTAAETLEELVESLARPRRVLLMVKAGDPVDYVISDLVPLLDEGDIIIDGGNSLFTDTERRCNELEAKGIRFLGIGVSGGEEGARHGPSIMPGGHADAWPHVEEMLKSIAAVAPDGAPCCEWIGPGGAGHFVKMVHNGIEYGDMQVIAEAYDLMRRGMELDPDALSDVFADWNEGRLESFLIEITADILKERLAGEPIVDKILDAAGQKGTGKWTVIASMESGQPTTLVAEAVYARIVSSDPDRRAMLAEVFPQPTGPGVRIRRPGRVRPLRLQDRLLRPRLPPSRRSIRRARLGPGHEDHRLAVACRLHHPGCLSSGHHGGLRDGSGPPRPDGSRLLCRCTQGCGG